MALSRRYFFLFALHLSPNILLWRRKFIRRWFKPIVLLFVKMASLFDTRHTHREKWGNDEKKAMISKDRKSDKHPYNIIQLSKQMATRKCYANKNHLQRKQKPNEMIKRRTLNFRWCTNNIIWHWVSVAKITQSVRFQGKEKQTSFKYIRIK